MKINRILIPTDFSETAQMAVAHGVYMAQLFKAKIYLLHSIESQVYAGMQMEQVPIMELETGHVNLLEKLNRQADEIANRHKVEVLTVTSTGKPPKEIAAAVKENEIDIIIMGTHGANGFEEFFIGSNTDKVVHIAPCPVISVQVFANHVGFSNIIMPIDNDLHSRQKVNNVIELAKVYKPTVHILGLLDSVDSVDANKFDIKLDSVEHAIRNAGITYTRNLIHGNNLANEALQYSKEVGGDLIVIMTGHESEMNEPFLSAFAKQIVNHSKIPVMSIKPEETTIELFDPEGGTGVII